MKYLQKKKKKHCKDLMGVQWNSRTSIAPNGTKCDFSSEPEPCASIFLWLLENFNFFFFKGYGGMGEWGNGGMGFYFR